MESLRIETTIEEDVWENASPKNIFRQSYESVVINPGRPVFLCRDASSIPAYTQEGAAISMKADADAAYALYQAVKNKGDVSLPMLKQVYLNAAVKIKQIDRDISTDEEATEVTSYFTDNAVFMPGEEPTLMSFPLSEDSKKFNLLNGVPLWDVKGVFQHEFGHFIFQSLMEDGSPFASYHEYAEKNPDLHLFQTPLSTSARIAERPALRSKLAEFVMTQDFFVGSLNEGFADLWAYYTLKQPADMFEITCFSKNRNVASPTFFNGISKAWDDGLWNKIFNFDMEDTLASSSTTPIEACSQPYFTDIHIVGAAMAHTADAVFTVVASSSPTQDASLLKAEMSIAWLKSIKDSAEFGYLGGKASLSRILNTAIGTGMGYLNDTDKTALCNVVSSKFPVLVKRWKDAKTDNEDVAGVVSYCSL